MILHCVFFSFRPETSGSQREDILRGLANFSATVDGALAFEAGPNRDFERKSEDYGDGFVIRFRDSSALKTYADHPTHRQLGKRLCDLCVGGADGIVVFDLDVPDGQS